MADDLSLGDRKAVQTELEKRKEEASFIGWVNMTEKGKKEKVILVVGTYRLLTLRSGGKVAREAHWLELVEVQSKKSDEMSLTFKSFKVEVQGSQIDDIINHIRDAFDVAFPGVPQNLKFKMDVSPASRVREAAPPEQPLGGFISTYKSMCDFHGVEVREDFCWDMENLFIPGNVKDFNLKEFEQPIGVNEVKTLIGALQYNTYFKSLTAKNLALDKTMTGSVAECLKFNSALEEITISRASVKSDGIAAISEALSFNRGLALTSITISHNPIEDKGMIAFAHYIGGMSRGLVKLDISNCGAGKSGMQALGNALKKNVHMGSTLTFFDISHNKLESDGSGALGAFLANPNSLSHLLMSNTGAILEVTLGAMVRGCNHLSVLDISENKLTRKETGILAKYLQASANLVNLNIRATGVPVESVKELISAVSSNPYLKDFSLNLGDNKLGPPGARVIASLAEKMNNITSLDVSENDLGDEGIAILAEGLSFNGSLKHLNVKGNFKSRTKARNHAVDLLVKLIGNGSESSLESLNVAGSKGAELKLDIIPLLYELATNDKLTSLDISGNQITNKGASALGKALQTNDKLTSLLWDNNLTTLQGFQSFNVGLKRNHTLIHMPLPINDISAALKGYEQQVTDVVEKIEANLARNQNPTHKFTQTTDAISGKSGQSFGFLSSGQREEVQKLLFKIKSTGKKVEVPEFKVILEDAEVQDQIMTSLFSLDDQIHQAFEHELKKELIGFVKSASPLYIKMKGELIEQLMTSVRKSYKCFPEDTVKRLQTNLAFGGKDLSEDEFERVIVTAAGAELSAKANQAFHQTVTIASDYLYEKMHDQLQNIMDDLTSEGAPSSSAQVEEAKKTPRDAQPAAKAAAPAPTKATGPAPKNLPTPPPKGAAAAPAKPAKPAAKKTTAPSAAVDSLPKVESTLEHAVKDRPTQQKRPPTRKKRPAPPQQSGM